MAEMSLAKFGDVFMVYGLDERDGVWVPFNREYRAIGAGESDSASSGQWGFKMTRAQKEKVAHSENGKTVWLYDDGCNPTYNRATRARYMRRIAALMTCAVVRVPCKDPGSVRR